MTHAFNLRVSNFKFIVSLSKFLKDLDIFDSGSSGHSNGSNDDGFFDELTSDIADSAISFNAPANLMGLINEPLCSSKRKVSDVDKENQVPKSKPIFIKPVGMPTTRPRSCSLSVKRDSPATLSPSPMKRKKRPRHVYRSKSFYDTNPDDLYMSEKVCHCLIFLYFYISWSPLFWFLRPTIKSY